MKKNAFWSLIFILLMTLLTGCSKKILGIKLQWIGIPLLIILICVVGVIVYKNYKSIVEEKEFAAEMKRREAIFAAEEAERQKKLAAEKQETDS